MHLLPHAVPVVAFGTSPVCVGVFFFGMLHWPFWRPRARFHVLGELVNVTTSSLLTSSSLGVHAGDKPRS